MNLETSQLSLSFKLFSKWADHFNPHKNNNIPALFASKYSRLRICEQLNKGKAQAAVPVICATKHLLLSRGLSGRPPALCSLINPRRVCIFRHDTPLDAFHHRWADRVIIYLCQQRKVLLSVQSLPDFQSWNAHFQLKKHISTRWHMLSL